MPPAKGNHPSLLRTNYPRPDVIVRHPETAAAIKAANCPGSAVIVPALPGRLAARATESNMSFLSQISFDEVAASLFACLVLREIMILALPDRIAGPGGWLVDTGEEEA